MDNLNDAYLDVLSNYSGSVDDRRKAYLMDYLNYVNTTSLNDLEWAVLQKLGYKNSLTDAWLDHLKGLGGMTLSDKGGLLSSTFYGSSPSRLFLNNEVGVYYDPSDLTTLFQDSAGTTPVTAAGQPVGLMLDKSKGLALGAELVTNGDFSVDANWTKGAGWVISGGIATATATGASNNLSQAGILPSVGRSVRVTFTATRGSGTLGVFAGLAATGFVIATSGTYTFIAVVAGDTTLYVQGNSTFTGTVDNISIRELAGNHATQATAAQRPTYGIHPYSGVRNIANGSAAYSDINYWPSTGTGASGITTTKTVGSDATGPYVDIRFFSALTTGTSYNDVYSFAYSRTPAVAGEIYTTSATLQLVGGTATNISGMRASVAQETAPSTFIGSANSAFVTSSTAQTVSGSITVTIGNQVRGSLQLTCALGVAIDATYRIRELQFEKSATRTAYQANYSQYNITEANVSSVSYLSFDGVDDGMATSAIDFSATDAVTVFTGLRKLSDAARAMVVELGSPSATGSFQLSAPASAASNYAYASTGNVASIFATSPSSYPFPDTAVLTGKSKISTDVVALRRNGTQVGSSSADQGTVNYSNSILYVGRRNAATLPFSGNIYSLIVRGAESNTNQITNVENWINAQTGAY